ncbi:MAG TPA: CPBP family glutamic-type intramembrane protease [Pyrinomonadaceae bacterium]|nr:CPBP family glutamic-type intramembrane protease [Pyrinomonadaceae bacterium]
MTYKTKLSAYLFLAGFVGILSFLLVDLSALLAMMPVQDGTKLPSPWLLKLLSLIQPTALLALAVFGGVFLSPKVNLAAPAFEALARGKSFTAALKPQIIPGVIAGLIAAAVLVLSWAFLRPFMPGDFVTRAEAFNRLLPLPTRLLYGGITEELLLRWGLLTLLVWVAWRVFQRRRPQPGTVCFVGAILISSIVFGVGHLPVAVAIGGPLTLPVVAFVVTVNGVFGLIAGYLFWRKGLEAAIIAHMLAHVGIVSASYFGS